MQADDENTVATINIRLLANGGVAVEWTPAQPVVIYGMLSSAHDVIRAKVQEATQPAIVRFPADAIPRFRSN
jgi:hypothetical protein